MIFSSENGCLHCSMTVDHTFKGAWTTGDGEETRIVTEECHCHSCGQVVVQQFEEVR